MWVHNKKWINIKEKTMKTKSVKEIKEIIDDLKPNQYLEYIDIL